MVYKTDRITLPLRADHSIDGKYYAFVDPTVAGFYQANVLGKISDTVVSLSMHPSKVDEREYIEFPERENQNILEAQVAIMAEIAALRNQTLEISEELDVVQDAVRSGQDAGLTYVAIALGGIGIAVAAIAIVLARTIRSFWRKMLLGTDHHVTLFSTSFNFSGLHAGTGDCRTLLECRVAYFYRQV